MIKLKEITKYLDKNGISYWRSENNQKLILRACAFNSETESNFYDYGEPPKPIKCFDQKMQFIFNDPRVVVINCGECWGCAGW